MTEKRYEKMFTAVAGEGRGVFIPFVVVGDPDMATSLEIIKTLAAAGADALELGIPFSDPVADGPTIQTAVVRALDNGATPDNCLALIGQVREAYPDIPIGILTYANAVMSRGMDTWFEKVSAAGIDSVLAADMPVYESDDFIRTAKAAGVQPVFIAPPNADDNTMKAISARTEGYTYVVARKGVTGVDQDVQIGFRPVIEKLESFQAPPPVVGFGISEPDHVKEVLDAGAKGAISGSAVVKIVERNIGRPDQMKLELTAFVSKMRAATKR